MITILLQKILEQVKALKINIENFVYGRSYTIGESVVGYFNNTKVYSYTFDSSNFESLNIDLNFLNIDAFLGFSELSAISTNSGWITPNYYRNNSDYFCIKRDLNNKLIASYPSSYQIYGWYITILYTKMEA
jgi:hypothetical protein